MNRSCFIETETPLLAAWVVHYHGIPQTDFDTPMLRLLNYADMITGPTGIYVTIEERIIDIANRYGKNSQQELDAIKLSKQIKSFE